jgi:hypothetical protein
MQEPTVDALESMKKLTAQAATTMAESHASMNDLKN